MDSWFFPFFVPAALILFGIAGPEEAKNLAGKRAPPDSDPFNEAEFGKNPARLSSAKRYRPTL